MCMSNNNNQMVTKEVRQEGACTRSGFQRVRICVPVTVRPFAIAGTPITRCCGMPTVLAGGTCEESGILNGVCIFSITQEVCVEVPVEFGANAEVGMPYNECLGASNTDCTDCIG